MFYLYDSVAFMLIITLYETYEATGGFRVQCRHGLLLLLAFLVRQIVAIEKGLE